MILDRLIAWVLRHERWWLYLAIPLVSFAMHWTIWGKDLQGPHVWRQTGTQQTIDSFVEEDFCILNPRHLERGTGDGIFRVEFPLYQWLIAAVAKVVGNSVLLMRLCTFFIGCLGIWAMHVLLILLVKDRLTALLGAFFFAFAPLVYYYSVCAMPDVFALMLAMWGLVYVLRLEDGFGWGKVVASAILLGMAVLVKLPYIIFLPAFGLWMFREFRRTDTHRWRKAALIAAIAGLSLVPAALWYAWVIPGWGSSGALSGIFYHLADWSEIAAIFKFHLLEMYPRTVMNIACLPLLAWGAFKCVQKRGKMHVHRGKSWILWAVVASFFLYYGYEIWLISYHHDYYLLPIVPFWVIVAAIGAGELIQSKRSLAAGIAIALVALVPYMTYRRIHPRWQDQNAEVNLDFARYKKELRAAVPDDALVVSGTDESRCIVPYFIHKKGWAWTKSQGLSPEKLAEWISLGARYFYCDDRRYDQDPAIKALLGPEIARYGSVRVYQLGE